VNNVTPITSRRGGAVRADVPSQRTSRIHLLGGMRAVGPAGDDILPRAKKTQAVLAYLCLAQGERVSRSRVAGMVWDRVGEIQARDSLRHALNELERIGGWRLDSDRETVRLDIADCWVDAFEGPEVSELLLDGLHGISPAFDQWLFGERARFENRWQSKLEGDLDDLITKEAAPDLRAAAARRLLNFMPTHEPAVRSLMTAFAEMGDRAQAVREFERFRQLFDSNLGMPPSEKTIALYSAIRRAPQSRPARSSNWPLPSTGADPVPSPQQSDLTAPMWINATSDREREPSIAVLPFRDLSAETGRNYVAEGLVEDLVEALSRVPGLFVISRLSSAAFRNQERLPQEIGGALGVRYLLSGTIRSSGDRLRITVELTDTNSSTSLWNSRYDESFSDLLEVQDRLTEAVIRSVAPRVRAAEVQRVRIKRPDEYGAYDFLLRAQENMHSADRAIFESSEGLFELALARDPHYAAALAWRAYWHVMRVGQGWSLDRAADAELAERFAQRAIECDQVEPMAFAVRGHAAAYLHRNFDLAFSCFDKALEINPNSARAWLWNASAHAWTGDGPHAVEKITRAMALSPYDPLVCAYSGSASAAYLADHQYLRSVEFGLRCIRDNKAYSAAYKTMIPALVMAGHEDEARAQLQQLLRLEPDFTVETFRDRFPGGNGLIGELCCDGLARAGAPLSA
jgi:TolB-like protein/DNA-binding SARP family transcriptional activator